MNNYIKGLGILVGKFTEEDLRNKIDKQVVAEKSKEYNLKYTNAKIIKEKGIRKLAIYLCNIDDFRIGI